MLDMQDTLSAGLTPEFEIMHPLGAGQLGVVYLARETALKRLVAVKVPRPDLASDTLARRRFEREARAAARLTHPNIVAIHRVGRLPDSTPYLVMAYIEGRTLAAALKAEGPLPEDVAICVLAQLASALATAHEQGVVHRNVRPDNVIWQVDQRRAVLTDFGLAGILETGTEIVTQLTGAGEVVGDPAHNSPEQLLGDPLTTATDVYGLGLLGYEVLTLQKPYRVSSLAEWATAHLRQVPRDLAELLPGVDARLAELLLHCLEKHPEHRPRAAEVERRLQSLERRHRRRAGDAGTNGNGALRTLDAAVDQLPALRTFLKELKKRRVFNVAILYGAATFAVFQLADSITSGLPPSHAGAAAYKALIVVTLLGFPVAIVLAWMFDLSTSGVKRAQPGEEVMSRFPLRLFQGLALALTLLIVVLAGWWLL